MEPKIRGRSEGVGLAGRRRGLRRRFTFALVAMSSAALCAVLAGGDGYGRPPRELRGGADAYGYQKYLDRYKQEHVHSDQRGVQNALENRDWHKAHRIARQAYDPVKGPLLEKKQEDEEEEVRPRLTEGYVPPSDPFLKMRATQQKIQRAPEETQFTINRRKRLNNQMDFFRASLARTGVDLGEGEYSQDEEEKLLPQIPDELTAEERMLLDPKLMAKQIREAQEKEDAQNANLAGVKNPAFELVDDISEDLGSDFDREEAAEQHRSNAEEITANAARRPAASKGRVYTGRVTSLRDFGAFVDFGCSRNGLLSVKEICDPDPRNISDVLYVHDTVAVLVTKIDSTGRVYLSMKGYNPGHRETSERKPPPEPKEPVPPAPEPMQQFKKRPRILGSTIPDWDTVIDPLQRKLYEYDMKERIEKQIERDTYREHRRKSKALKNGEGGDQYDQGAAAWHQFVHDSKPKTDDPWGLGDTFKLEDYEPGGDKENKKSGGGGEKKHKKKHHKHKRKYQKSSQEIHAERMERKRKREAKYEAKLDRGTELAARRGLSTAPKYGGYSGIAD